MAHIDHRNHKYIITLKDDVSNADLIKAGFNLERTRNFYWAHYNEDDLKKMLIIKLSPPERRLMFRYQSSDEKYDLLEEIKGLEYLFDIKKAK